MNRDAVSDYPQVSDRPRRGTGLSLSDAPVELTSRGLSPLTSLIVVTLLSTALWAAIWMVVRWLLWG